MKALCLACALSLTVLPAAAQTMEPAVGEAGTASSSGCVVVPLLGLLLLLTVISGGSGSPAPLT